MYSVGKILKEERIRKKLSIVRLSQKTKIKEKFLIALEKEEWQNLPNFATTRGFVYTVAANIGLSPEPVIALLRRDFEQTEKTGVKKQTIVWTPSTTFTTLAGVAFFLLGTYLFIQYKNFTAPPPLTISEIKRENSKIVISGQTSNEAQLLLNNESVLVRENGTFSITITAESGTKLIVEARSRSGKSTTKEIVSP